MLRRLLRLIQLFRTTLRVTLRRVECRRSGAHLLVLCQIEVNRQTGMQRHTHACGWCQTLVLDQTKAVDDDIRLLLSDLGISIDPGLTLPEQGQYMN